MRNLAAWGVKNWTKHFTKMAEIWPFLDKKLAFFSQSPLEPILAPKKFWKSYDRFRPIFLAKRRILRPNFYPKTVSKGILLVKMVENFQKFHRPKMRH